MPPSLTAERRRRGRAPDPFGIGVVLVQFHAAFENIPQTGQDRLVGAAGRFADPGPIAFARSAREPANETGGEYAARQVPLRRVARKASCKIAADGGDRR